VKRMTSTDPAPAVHPKYGHRSKGSVGSSKFTLRNTSQAGQAQRPIVAKASGVRHVPSEHEPRCPSRRFQCNGSKGIHSGGMHEATGSATSLPIKGFSKWEGQAVPSPFGGGASMRIMACNKLGSTSLIHGTGTKFMSKEMPSWHKTSIVFQRCHEARRRTFKSAWPRFRTFNSQSKWLRVCLRSRHT